MTTSDGMDKIWERYDRDFLAKPRNRIHRLDKARFEKWAEETGYTCTPTQIPPSQSLPDNLYRERKAAKETFYVSKEDEDQYVKDVALLRRVTMRKRGKIPLEGITEEERISSSESDPEPNLNEDEDLYPQQTQKTSRPKQQKGKEGIVIREHTARSGRITSIKLPAGLQRDGTQIRKLRQQDRS